jgi:xeroderma pigmentosum group C-complementing protein
VNHPDQVEVLFGKLAKDVTSKRGVLAYAIAVEHTMGGVKFTDVTARYAHSFVASLRVRGLFRGRARKKTLSAEELKRTWWGDTVVCLNRHLINLQAPRYEAALQSRGSSQLEAIGIDSSDDEKHVKDAVEDAEIEELRASAENEALPTSKATFQSHPVYVLRSLLGTAEVLAPEASQRVCGVFKGELVYRRSDASTAHPARKWPYLGRKVQPTELGQPVKQTKARKKPVPKNFKALKSYGVGKSNDGSMDQRAHEIHQASQPLDDGMERLYAHWQTDPWSPAPVGAGDRIPVNVYRNVELELLNPGLVHVEIRGIAAVAKKLGIPYAPCMLGFEGQGGNRAPTIRGIVVHAHNEVLLREAGVEVTIHAEKMDSEKRRHIVFRRWKKLLNGLLTKDRLDAEYG